MMKKMFFLLVTLCFTTACSMSEEDVVEETMAASDEVNNYTLDITTANPNEEEDSEYTLNIDLENTLGYITSEYTNEHGRTSEELYYNSETVFEKLSDSDWTISSLQVEDMHEYYFVDYTQIAQVLEYIEPMEETSFEALDETYEFSYQADNQSDATALLEEWGFNLGEEPVTDASIVFHINNDNYYIENIELEYTMQVGSDTEIDLTQQLDYQNINDTEDIERPEGTLSENSIS
ncbi:hypothetical protein NP439_13340 [Oceanobacillus jeddahense]|uniref:DUF5067 domain-containing protein n=2 Tax=Oceanobacillus jeddahense TaxID=1462527 RepID=A0ABY5JL77_9BACI|nr:hypothetical protein [Oceanobacillus jeddahense]UUI01056.1 hypothetical protein NP439_13340 [Oceanobacillus jeddahense]